MEHESLADCNNAEETSNRDMRRFIPIVISSEWLDRNANLGKKITTAILLPAGISTDNVSVDLVQSGMALEMTVTWPSVMCDPTKLFSPYIENKEDPLYTLNHPEVLGFEKVLKELRMNNGQKHGESIVSKAIIALPDQVEETSIESTVLPFQSGDASRPESMCAVLLVRFLAVEDSYVGGQELKRPKLMAIKAHPTVPTSASGCTT